MVAVATAVAMVVVAVGGSQDALEETAAADMAAVVEATIEACQQLQWRDQLAAAAMATAVTKTGEDWLRQQQQQQRRPLTTSQ